MSTLDLTSLIVNALGALAFGIVMGWITYRTLRNSKVNGVPDIAAVIGAVGGAAVTVLFPLGTIAFGAYCIGLAIGFFSYLRNAMNLAEKYGSKKDKAIEWLGSDTFAATGELEPEPTPLPDDA